MTCHDARGLFSARIDDALTTAERAGLDAHLAGCPDCRRELARFEGTVGLLRAAAPVRAPAGFVDRVLAAAGPVPRAAGWYRSLGRRLFWPLEVKLPLEAAALVLVAVGAVYVYERSPEREQLTRLEPPVTRATEPVQEALRSAPPAPLASSADAPAKDAPRASTAPSIEPPVARQVAPPAAPPVAPGRKEQAPAPERAGETSEFAREGQRRDAAEEKSASGALQDRRRVAAAKAGALAERSGRLAVGDREAAGRALAALLARVGATEVGRRAEGRDVVVEVLVPGPAYPELAEGLAGIGRWQPDPPPVEPAETTVRVRLRLTD